MKIAPLKYLSNQCYLVGDVVAIRESSIVSLSTAPLYICRWDSETSSSTMMRQEV